MPGFASGQTTVCEGLRDCIAGPKQKIFFALSRMAQDLVPSHQRSNFGSSQVEYRLLPSVPESGIAMASGSFATPSAALQVDALRKADVVSVAATWSFASPWRH